MLWPLAVHTSRWAFDIEYIWCSETVSFDAAHTQTLPLWFLDQTANAGCVMPHCSATEMFGTYLFAEGFYQ